MSSSGFSITLEVFKEPRGLLRLIQFLFTILAFSTTAGYNSEFTFNYRCQVNNATGTRTIVIGYPFWLETGRIEPLECPSGAGVTTLAPGLYYPFGSYTSSAQFFVFVGVVGLLYTVGITVVYVFFDEVYRSQDLVPKIDFGFTAVWTLFWFISSIAWSVGVSALKLETYYERIWHQVTECLQPELATCSLQRGFAYGGLNVSLICGYTSVFLWGSCLWFLFKETEWWRRMHPEEAYADKQQQEQQQQQQQAGDYDGGAGFA